jgi:hypothetical protein
VKRKVTVPVGAPTVKASHGKRPAARYQLIMCQGVGLSDRSALPALVR